MITSYKTAFRCFSFILATLIMLSGISVITASADYSTGVGLAAHALNAYYDGWSYVYGGSSPGAVDCSGLICTYNGVGGVRTSMLASSSESGYICNGIPNIHGLGLYQPGHVGVYVGSGMAVDARSEYYGVCYQSVYTKSWTSWFKVCGVSYPNTGWVKFQGNSYYYENGEYITSTSRTIDGVTYYFDSMGCSDAAPDESAYQATDYSSVSVSPNYQDSYSDDSYSDDSSYDYSNDSSYSQVTSSDKYKTLYSGAVGEDVSKLQSRLKTLGYFNDDVTDFYGSLTQNAISVFQEAAELSITGVADNETQELLYSDFAPIWETPELTVGDYSDDVLLIQQTLSELGYFYDEPTGYFGDVTAIAVSQFQSANGLYSTGIVDSVTRDFILSDDATANPNEGTISYGMKGDSVRALQQRLIDLRYLCGIPSEEFDDDTLSAIHLYQSTAGLDTSNALSSDDISRLYASDAPKSPDYDKLQLGYIGDDVKDMQIKLMGLDLYDGLLSGYFDETTLLAVKDAQQTFGLVANGIADESFMKALSAETNKNNVQTNSEIAMVGASMTTNALAKANAVQADPVVTRERNTKATVKLVIIASIILMTAAIFILVNVLSAKQKRNYAYSKVNVRDNGIKTYSKKYNRPEKVIRR